MPSVATVKQESVGGRIRKSVESIPLLGILVSAVFTFFERQMNAVRKRKSIYKLALYFRYQMWMAILGSALFLFLSLAQLAGLAGILKPQGSCTTETSALMAVDGKARSLYDVNGVPDAEVFMLYTEQERRSVGCIIDPVQDQVRSICSRTQATFLAGLMLSIGIFYLIVTAACLFLTFGYSFFSNIPSDSITTDASDCRITCLGCIAKQGPKLLRLANVAAFLCLLAVVVAVEGARMCKGDVAMSHQCLSFHDDCAFNQIKNCVFYFSSHCADKELGLPSSGLSYKEAFRKCVDPKYFSRFSGRFDVRVVHKTNCARCWLLHFDCLDTAVDLVRVIKATEPNFAADPKSTVAPYYGDISPISSEERHNLFKLLKCKCAKTSSISSIFDALSCDPLPGAATQVCDISQAPSIATRIPDLVFKDEDDDAFLSERSDRTFQIQSKQFCKWLPNLPPYFFEESECAQSGSFVSRIASLGAIVMLFLAALVILVGALLRVNVQQETWCYDPHRPDENSCWTLVRRSGPG